jgi:xylulokinase
MTRTLVAGVDSSTQQTKLVVVDAATGELVRSSALPHPDGTELDPEHWWSALHGVGGTRPVGASAVSIAAQQHTTIFLDEAGASARTRPISSVGSSAMPPGSTARVSSPTRRTP